jgi:thioredoxin-related protein
MARKSFRGGDSTSNQNIMVAILTGVFFIVVMLFVYILMNTMSRQNGRRHAQGPAAQRQYREKYMEHFHGGQNCEYSMIFFNMDGCPHCAQFHPEWKKFSKYVKQHSDYSQKVCVKEYSSDDTEYTSKYKVDGYPTVVLEDMKSGKQTVYEGQRTSDALKSFLAQKTS